MELAECDGDILIIQLDYIPTLSYITRPCWLRLNSYYQKARHALVAQLDRVLGYEPSGRRFESFRVRHIRKPGLVPGFLCQ